MFKPILLKTILFEALNLENDIPDASSSQSGGDITSRTLHDTFDLANTGLEYVKRQIEKLNKKAKRIGAPPLEIKVISEFDKDVLIRWVKTRAHFFKVRVEGKSPVIDGYEFIASIEHAEEGNIVNISPSSTVRAVPPEYLTTKNTCDYCHTKRDRLHTFILKKTGSDTLMKVGRSCLKNFLPGKDPSSILAYGEMLSNALRELVAGEELKDYDGDGDGGGGRGWSRYYPAEKYLWNVCLAYSINGKFVGAKAARDAAENGDDSVESTAKMAWFLMESVPALPESNRLKWEETINNRTPRADKLYSDLEKWMSAKDWDVEIDKHEAADDGFASYYHNLKVLAKSTTISRKNSNLHASILGNYLREIAYAEKKSQAANAPQGKFMGQVGGKIEFIGTVTKTKDVPGFQPGTTATMIMFKDDDGNDYIWWASGRIGIEVGEKYVVKAKVKSHTISKYTNRPETAIFYTKLTPV